MRLRTLRLRNYRRFRDAVLEFPEGVIGVTGPNGAGKSTLIESITWCLFGHDAARTGKDHLRRAGAAPGDDVEVRLEFELDGAAYSVTRRMRGKSQQAEAEVQVDGQLIVAPGANSSEQTTKRVARALGMDRRGFQATVVANQGDLAALSNTHPGERKRLVLSLLGVDELDAAIVLARTRKREAGIRLEELRRVLGREGEAAQRLERSLADLRASQTELEAATAEAVARGARADELEAAAKALDAVRDRHRELRMRLDGLQRALAAHHDASVRAGSELQLLDQRAQELARLREGAQRFEDLDARLATLDEHRKREAARGRLEAEHEALRRELERWTVEDGPPAIVGATEEALGAEAGRLRAAVEAAASRLAQVEAHAQHVDLDRRRLQADAASHGEKWRELATLGADAACPLCERPLGEALERLSSAAVQEQAQIRGRVELLGTEREQLRVQAEAVRREQEDARRRLEGHERLLEALRRKDERLRVAQGERGRLARRRAALEAELAAIPSGNGASPDARTLEAERVARDTWRQSVARLEAETARVPRLRSELATVAAQAEATRHEIEAASRELGQVQHRDGAWEQAQHAAAEERGLCHEAERRRDVLAERVQGLRAQIGTLREDVARLGTLREEATALEERVHVGELLAGDRGDVGLLPEFRRHLIGRIRPALARTAGDLVAAMTGGRYADLAIDEDYTIQVFDGAAAWPVERFSGGEVDVMNLAVRLAVGELLARARRSSRLQFVALDEVLASQDEARRRSVLEALKSLGTHFRQVLLVTHLDEVRERVDHIVRVVPDLDGTSHFEPSWVDAA